MLRVHAGAAAMCRLSLNGGMVEYEGHPRLGSQVLFCRRRTRRFRALFAGVLVRVAEWDGALLGVAHLHRGFRDTLDGATHVTRTRTCLLPACLPACLAIDTGRVAGASLPRNLTYFAHHYTHFFFTRAFDGRTRASPQTLSAHPLFTSSAHIAGSRPRRRLPSPPSAASSASARRCIAEHSRA